MVHKGKEQIAIRMPHSNATKVRTHTAIIFIFPTLHVDNESFAFLTTTGLEFSVLV